MHWEEIAGELCFSPGLIETMKSSGSGKGAEACLKDVLHKWMADASGMPNADKYPCTWRGMHTLLLETTHTTIANDLKEAIEATYTDFKKTYDQGNITVAHFPV